MKDSEKDDENRRQDIASELYNEKRIALSQVAVIIILLILSLLLVVFNEDSSYIAIWIRDLFTK